MPCEGIQGIPSCVDTSPQMNPGRSLRRLARPASLAVPLALCALTPATALAMSAPPADPSLSPRLAELSAPAVRAAPPAEQAARLGLAASGPGSLLRDGNRVLAEVRFESGAAAALGALRAAGAEIVHVSGAYQTVTVAAPPADLPAIGDVAGVGAVTEVLTPIVRGSDCGGAVRSEGDTQLNAANARASFGVDGSGVTVGILSDSFDRDLSAATHAAGDVASGDLPGPGSPCGSTAPVDVLDDSEAAGADEGRGMAQIVHDLAPGAALDFATAFTGELAFAANIRALAAAGAKVIADDVAYFEEPFFQDGPVAVAVDEAAAAGVSYFTAAGNDNLIDSAGRDIASWEAPAFRDSGSCPAGLLALPQFGAGHCMDFNPGPGKDDTFGITVSKGATLTLDLQWAEPWNGVDTDLDAFLLDSKGKPLKVEVGSQEFVVGATGDNLSTERPVEILQWENDTGSSAEVQLAIDDCFGACNPGAGAAAAPRLKLAMLENGYGVTETEYPESSGGDTVGPTVFGHAGASGAIAVGAVGYDAGVEPERYSSRGPVHHYFGPVSGATAAPAIDQTIPKPDLAATDCGATTFFARLEAGVWRFCGTSAAAPHAAAVAALARQADPGASADAVRAALTGTAHRGAGSDPDAVGSGLLDAYGAVAALPLPPKITITKASAPLSDADAAAHTGSGGIARSTIGPKRPRARIVKHPPRLIRTHRRSVRASFRFAASAAGVTFVCKVDRGLLHFCGPRFSRRFGAGAHVLEVRASDAAGNVDRTASVFRFRVKRLG